MKRILSAAILLSVLGTAIWLGGAWTHAASTNHQQAMDWEIPAQEEPLAPRTPIIPDPPTRTPTPTPRPTSTPTATNVPFEVLEEEAHAKLTQSKTFRQDISPHRANNFDQLVRQIDWGYGPEPSTIAGIFRLQQPVAADIPVATPTTTPAVTPTATVENRIYLPAVPKDGAP